ncbi:MAG: hypothetical protein WA892_11320 [Ornithinimicrobium sp.]
MMIAVYGVLLVLGVVLLVTAAVRVWRGGISGGRARASGSEGVGARSIAADYEQRLSVLEGDGS